MQPEGPAVLGQEVNDLLQISFQPRIQIRTRFQKILEVSGGEHQHFARAVAAEHVVAVARLHHFRPALEVVEFSARLLSEEIIGNAQGHLPSLMKLPDDFVVFRVILETSAGVAHTGHSQPVQLAHEVARGIVLVFGRKLWPLGQGGVEDGRVRPRHKHAGWIAGLVAHDFAAGRIRRVLRVAAGPQRGSIQRVRGNRGAG